MVGSSLKKDNLSSTHRPHQARNQDFMWGVGGGGGANEAKVDQTTEIYFLIVWSVYKQCGIVKKVHIGFS